ncbi:hypothetical protein T439DRAFT_307526 [Meredithblackwellia eburnea MCA 4105]
MSTSSSPIDDSSTSPWADQPSLQEDQYQSALQRALGEEEDTQEEDEDEEEFGEFVYNGKDSVIDHEEQDMGEYEKRREKVLGSDDGDDDSTRPEGETKAKESNGNGLNGHLSPATTTNSAPSTTLPSPPTKQGNGNGNGNGQLTPSISISSSLNSHTHSMSLHPTRPASHPRISRLRSPSSQLPHHHNHGGRIISLTSSFSSELPLHQHQQSKVYSNSPSVTVSRRSSVMGGGGVGGLGGPTPSDLSLQDSVTPSPFPATTPARSQQHLQQEQLNFKSTPLRRLSPHLFPPQATKGFTPVTATMGYGNPTTMVVNGVIAVGTDKGWCLVFDFGQNLRGVIGNEGVVKESGAITSLALSSDHTFLLTGHIAGHIHLYSLLAPTTPHRSVPPVLLPQILSGRKEGHLLGTRITNVGFVGARHSLVVSADEKGLSFGHELRRVMGLKATDIVRLLGRYPDPSSLPPSSPSLSASKPSSPVPSSPTPVQGPTPRSRSSILSLSPLPLGPSPHPSDIHSLIAIQTRRKLVVVGMKPEARTWWRCLSSATVSSAGEKDGEEGDQEGEGGSAWWPSSSSGLVVGGEAKSGIDEKEKEAQGTDPVLAFAWGRKVRFVAVRRRTGVGAEEGAGAKMGGGIEFVEESGMLELERSVKGLQWYNERILFILTNGWVEVWDRESKKLLGRDPCSGVAGMGFKVHKQKLFLLTPTDVRVSTLLSWADRILSLMQPSTILSAIDLTTSYLLGLIDSSTISLPPVPAARHSIVAPKLREILNASLEFVFSEERLRDGSHADGEVMQALFAGLVGTCVRAALALGEESDISWLFDDLYDRYESNGIEGIFLREIEPFVLEGAVHALPPSVSQRLIIIHEERGEFEAAERVIWHVDPRFVDINQALGMCRRRGMYDAMVYVYTRCLRDSVAPLVEFLGLIKRIGEVRRRRPRWVGQGEDQDIEDDGGSIATAGSGTTSTQPARRAEHHDVESTVPDAYKVYAYVSLALSGLSFPSKDPLPYDEANLARNSLYSFLFSGSTRSWPEGGGGKPVLVGEDDVVGEPLYPYIRALLRFDAEAMLDALDLAFEDSYLEDDIPGRPVSRQQIIELLLEVMTAGGGPPGDSEFTPVDRTFFDIFVARNLPKYPQFITLPSKTLQGILVRLATDQDQSTVDDRQLAVEYLLSTYTPQDSESTVELFERAGFFRILRSIYRGERRWAALASTYLRDSDVGGEVFGFLRETLKLASRSTEEQRRDLTSTILDALPTLVQAHEGGLHETADLVDSYLPSYHNEVIDRLGSWEWRQFAYLRCLLEPDSADDFTASVKDRTPSTRLETPQRLLYLSLLCKHEPSHVLRFLEMDTQGLSKNPEALKICEEAEAYDALIWAVDRRGETKAALDRVDDTLESRTELLVKALMDGKHGEEREGGEEEGESERREFTAHVASDTVVDQIAAISRVAIQICVARTSGPKKTRQITSEDLWFRLLSSLVSTVRAVRAISPAPLRPSDRSSYRRISGASIIVHDDEPQSLSPRASDTISSLIPSALSSLVSTTSSRDVSFPKLMRRLIESNARSPAADRSYAEFKAIVTSMLDTYAFEGDLLALTSRISSQDLFEHVAELKSQCEVGWRARGELCAECAQSVWGPEGPGTSPPMSRSASVNMVVETLGMTGRPRMKKRPSLKGKEVEWPVEGEEREAEPALDPPKGIVVSRDGRVWHQSCHLEALGSVPSHFSLAT